MSEIPMTREPCPRCLGMALLGRIDAEMLQRLPQGAFAPRARDMSGRCCFDCAAADGLAPVCGSFEAARVAALEKAARKDASSTFRVEQVWESPTGLLYRVVDIRPREQHNTARISMRRGADGAGRLYVKRGESTFGWRLVTP